MCRLLEVFFDQDTYNRDDSIHLHSFVSRFNWEFQILDFVADLVFVVCVKSIKFR